MDKPRFSMLLLEPGEIYFEDFSCTMSEIENAPKDSIKPGRLKLCSKSLVFEPRNRIDPLIKMLYRDATKITEVQPKTISSSNDVISVIVKQYTEMLEDNVVAPYKFKYTEKQFFFKFDFASADSCLHQIHQLQRASTLNAAEHSSMIATILHSRYTRMVFDKVMMDDFTEEIRLELPVEKISPLVRNPGKLALTPTTLYLQPFNNIESSPMFKLKLCNLRRIFQRRFLQRQVGLEIYSTPDSSVPHIYLVFQNEVDRSTLYEELMKSSNVHLEKIHPEEMTLQWQNRVVSNYDYLMYLNSLADRSKNDLTQYPIFPWVLTDYNSDAIDLDDATIFRDLSKPMGALTKDRLAKLKERYDEMSEPKFLYGSHYSAPALVLFYLVRKFPHYMLCLQNGRFDHPDRMFNVIADVFNNCLTNMSDFKELIPEFYDTESGGDFLLNTHEIMFGERHDGTKVEHVLLPPWASDPEHFVRTMREALESEYVSRHLHLWIDLIFGYKQRGEEAVKANNLFHHVCYEGSVDLDNVYDMHERHALEVQIMEFGQVPKQLFTKPHARRMTHQIEKASSVSVREEQININQKLEMLDTIQIHREEVTCVVLAGERVVSVGKDGVLKVYHRGQRKQIRSIALCSMPLSSCVMVDANTVAVGAWDNHIYLYNLEYGRLIDSFRAHDDSVSCLLWLAEERLLVSGGLDCVVRVWADVGHVGQSLKGLRAELDHYAHVTALTLIRKASDFPTGVHIVSGTCDGEVYIWNLSTKKIHMQRNKHRTHVTSLCFISYGDRLITTSEDGEFDVMDLSVLNSVYNKMMPEAITSMCWDGRSTLWLGGCRGTILQWNMFSITQVSEDNCHGGSINSIFWHDDSRTLLTASADKSVIVWRATPGTKDISEK